MRKILTIATSILTLPALASCGGSDKPCLTKAQLENQISKIDNYSWYDPTQLSTIERLSPEKVGQVFDIEKRACGGEEAHALNHMNGGQH